MSGIFGIVNLDGKPVEQAVLERMAQSMAHRGVDNQGFWVNGGLALGHLTLCTTPESLCEKLPWKDTLSGLCITADARIDNRTELISTLNPDARLPTDIPDSQLILSAFRKWGKSCVDRLLGDFAFAIWDDRRQRLFVARDHMGLRPFYYHYSEKIFVFASTAIAISKGSRVPNEINEGRVADFLVNELEGINNTSTFFKMVYRMPPAHIGVLEHKKLSFHHYWKPDTTTCLQLRSDDDYADALEEALTLSVKARLRSQWPASSMLSGGVDSSSICGIANKLSRENNGGLFRSYSAVSDNVSNCSESGYISLMIDQGGLDPVLVNPSTIKNHSSDFETISGILEDPFDESWAMLRLIYLTARKHGNVVVMDGMGGDLIAGLTTSYPSYLLRQGDIKHAFREIDSRRTNYFEGQIGWLKAHTQVIRPVFTPNLMRHLKASLWTSDWTKACLRDSMLSKSFIRKVRLKDRWREYNGQSTLGFCPSLRHAHAESIVVPYLTAAIERYTRLASCCGVDSRQPFHDKRVVELCLSMPWQQKARNGWLKYCLRNALQRVAPAEVAWRSNFDSIMWKFGVAWNELNQKNNLSAISDNREQLLGILDKGQLDRMINRYTTGDMDAVDPISRVSTLIRWMENNKSDI